MNLRSKIEEIHASDIYGCFIEMGCGLAVTNRLMEVAGASKTIFAAESPYNQEIQHKKYPDTSKYRAVSWEMVRAVMKEWIPEDNNYTHSRRIAGGTYWGAHEEHNAFKVNTVYAATFQIGDELNKVSTHGWIGLWMNGKKYFYHVSIHKALSRVEYLSKIGEIGVEIIRTVHSGGIIPPDCCIDIILDENGEQFPDKNKKLCQTEMMFDMLTKSEEENFLTIVDGKMVRIETILRDEIYTRNRSITIFKGSFNPPHIAHIASVEVAERKLMGMEGRNHTIMMIAMEVYQKGWIKPDDMAKRVSMLNALGYPVIVTRSGYFNKNVEFLRRRLKDTRICFVVGTDTANRIIDSSYRLVGEKKKHDDYVSRNKDRIVSSVPIKELVELDNFRRDFKNVKFIVTERGGYDVAPELTDDFWLGKQFIICSESKITMSSSLIREKISRGEIEELRSMVPQKVFDLLVDSYKEKTATK